MHHKEAVAYPQPRGGRMLVMCEGEKRGGRRFTLLLLGGVKNDSYNYSSKKLLGGAISDF